MEPLDSGHPASQHPRIYNYGRGGRRNDHACCAGLHPNRPPRRSRRSVRAFRDPIDDACVLGRARRSHSAGVVSSDLRVWSAQSSRLRNCENRLHQSIPMMPTTNKPRARNPTMWPGEPLDENRSEMFPPSESMVVGEAEARVLVEIREYI